VAIGAAQQMGPEPVSSGNQVSPIPINGWPPRRPTVTEQADQIPVAQAVADLATRLAIDPNSITVVSAEAVTWPNGALGCAQPGRAYSQIVRPGYRIVL